MAMFPQFGAAPAAPTGGLSAPLLSFKAGKMEVKDKGGDKYLITPDLRKGSVTLFKRPDDQLMHFCWKERPSGNVVDDIIILPEEAVYKRVNTGREGDRVYLMEIAGNRRFFYWMQDKNAEKDEENMKKVNELTNSPPPDSAPAGGSGASSDMMDMIRSMQQAGVGGASGSSVPTVASGSRGEQGLNIQNLQSILQNMGFSPQDQAEGVGTSPSGSATSAASASAGLTTASSATAPASSNPAGGAGSASGRGLTSVDLQRAMMNLSGMTAQGQDPPISLSDVFNADAIEATGIMEDPFMRRSLIPLLAVGQQNEGELREILRSPQFQQTLAAMAGFIQVENFNNVMRSFELDPFNPRSAEALARGDAMEAMLQAIIYAGERRRDRSSRDAAPRQGGDGSRRSGGK